MGNEASEAIPVTGTLIQCSMLAVDGRSLFFSVADLLDNQLFPAQKTCYNGFAYFYGMLSRIRESA